MPRRPGQIRIWEGMALGALAAVLIIAVAILAKDTIWQGTPVAAPTPRPIISTPTASAIPTYTPLPEDTPTDVPTVTPTPGYTAQSPLVLKAARALAKLDDDIAGLDGKTTNETSPKMQAHIAKVLASLANICHMKPGKLELHLNGVITYLTAVTPDGMPVESLYAVMTNVGKRIQDQGIDPDCDSIIQGYISDKSAGLPTFTPTPLPDISYRQLADHPELHQGDTIVWGCVIAKFLGADPYTPGNEDLGCFVFASSTTAHSAYDGIIGQGEIILSFPPSVDTSTLNSGDDIIFDAIVGEPVSGQNSFGGPITLPYAVVFNVTDIGHDPNAP